MKRFFLGFLFLAAIICGICNNSNAEEGKIRIALYKDGGVSDGYKNDVAVIEQDPTLEYELVNGQQIRDGVLKNFDIVFLPGGSGKGQAASMGEDGVKQVKEFVKSGKGYIGICAGAYFPIQQEFINAKTKDPRWQRGSTELMIEFSELGLKIVGDKFKGLQEVHYGNGPVMDVNMIPNKPNVEVLAWYRTETAKNGTPAGIQVNSPAILLTTYGKGTVVTISPHPERTPAMNEVLLKLIHHVADNLCFNEEPPCVLRTETSQPNPVITPAVPYMDAMGSVEWIPEKDVSWFNTSKKLPFRAGERYKGLPYTQDGRYTNLEMFKELLKDVDGQPIYTGPTEPDKYRGTDCSSSCSYSWKHTIPYLPIMKTWHMEPGDWHLIHPQTGKTVSIFRRVGDYRFTDFHESKNIIAENGREVMERCYDQLLPGDALVKRPHGHVVMVCRVDKAAKVVYITEQGGTNPDDRSQFLSDHQTWRVQYPFTYDKLIEDGYLPIAINEDILLTVPEK